MTPEETRMMAGLIASNTALTKRLLQCKCGAAVADVPEKTRSSNAVRQARHRARNAKSNAESNGQSVTESVMNNGSSVSSYKEDLESEKEPFKALSPTLSRVNNSVIRNATDVTPEHVTRLHIDPTGEDRDWRSMMKPKKQGMS